MSAVPTTQAILVRNEPLRATAMMSTYEKLVIDDIARHRMQPGPVRRVLELMGRPVAGLQRWASTSESAMVRKVHDSVLSNVEKGIHSTIRASLQLQSDREIVKRFHGRGNMQVQGLAEVRGLSLLEMDAVAESYRSQNSVLIGAEGAALGALATMGTVIPYAQLAIPAIVAADVAASMTLLSRSATLISSCYGYPARDPVNIPHVLAAMTPTSLDSDEGFLVMKSAAVAELRAAGEFMKAAAQKAATSTTNKAATNATRKAMEKAVEETISTRTPKLVKFIQSVAARLGVVFTEKELGTLLPVAGAAINGGMNMAFHEVGHTLAKDYFREMVLVERYGYENVNTAVQEAMTRQS